MAKPAWLTITPQSGNGNDTVAYSATEHTGRVARTYVSTIVNAKIDDCTVNVSQTPKAEFVTIQSTASPSKVGGPLSITGTSNSAKLTFSWKQSPAPTLVVDVPAQYTAGGQSTNNGSAIQGDPGATASYDFSVSLTIPENATVGALTATLVVTAEGGQSAQCVITQAAGDPYLWVEAENQTEASITIPQDGSAVNVNVLSNDAWTVE